jgi:hypothetical protein
MICVGQFPRDRDRPVANVRKGRLHRNARLPVMFQLGSANGIN